MIVGETVAKARSKGDNPRGEARSCGLTGVTPTGPTARSLEIVGTRIPGMAAIYAAGHIVIKSALN